jgi:hypothetical protein
MASRQAKVSQQVTNGRRKQLNFNSSSETLNNQDDCVAKGVQRFLLHTTLDCLLRYKETEGPIMFIYGIM